MLQEKQIKHVRKPNDKSSLLALVITKSENGNTGSRAWFLESKEHISGACLANTARAVSYLAEYTRSERRSSRASLSI